MNRRHFLPGLAALGACGRRGSANTIEGRWEGKLTNGLSSMTVNFDFIPKPDKSFEFRFNCRDLLLVTHPVQTWRLEGPLFSFTLPLVEGPRRYEGRFGGPTFDVEHKPAGEKMHLRRLGRVPAAPYKEISPLELTPTSRSTRAQARIFSRQEALGHFYADLLARLGIATAAKETPGSGWVFTEDMEIPAPPADKAKAPEFLICLSPGYERIRAIAAFPCPIFVLLGEADERNEKLERGSRQIAYDLREALAKQKRKDFQISVIPKADRYFRVAGFDREYPRLTAYHIDHFRRFLARFEPSGSTAV